MAMKLQNKVLISEPVAQFYHFSKQKLNENPVDTLDEQLCFNYKYIIHQLWPLDYNEETIQKKLSSYEYKDYLKCFEKLMPIFQYARNTIQDNETNLQLEWLQNTKEYWWCWATLPTVSINPTHILESLLCMTALLENALANIYYTVSEGKTPPHLLKELVSSNELRKVFGWEAMIFLKIFLGSPNSINLRNICWHGFPRLQDISDIYQAILLLTIHSLGVHLNSIKFHITRHRYQIRDFSKFLQNFPRELTTSNSFNVAAFEKQLLITCADFHGNYLPIWRQLFEYYNHKEFVRFVILILPQIELILRLYYGQINHYNVQAKLDEYYITMETVFAADLPPPNKGCNQLLQFAWHSSAEGCFKLMYDLFLAPNGCRLRDKVSHGEVLLEALNNSQLSTVLLHIFASLLLPESITILKTYESQLHVNCQTKVMLLKGFHQIQDLCQTEIIEFKKSLQLDERLKSQVSIYQRPHRERELMLILYKISKNIYETLDHYTASLKRSCNLLKKRELHSRQRQTLENLLSALPNICNCLFEMWETVKEFFILTQNHSLFISAQPTLEKTIKFFKHFLTISENLIKYSAPEINKWIKMLELCEKFRENKNKYFINDVLKNTNNKNIEYSSTECV